MAVPAIVSMHLHEASRRTNHDAEMHPVWSARGSGAGARKAGFAPHAESLVQTVSTGVGKLWCSRGVCAVGTQGTFEKMTSAMFRTSGKWDPGENRPASPVQSASKRPAPTAASLTNARSGCMILR